MDITIEQFSDRYLDDFTGLFIDFKKELRQFSPDFHANNRKIVRPIHEISRYLAKLSSEHKIFIAVVDERIIGFVCVKIVVPNHPVFEEDYITAEVSNLYVIPEHRGKNAAKKLMQRSYQYCGSRNVDIVKLSVLMNNPVKETYFKNGYELGLQRMYKVIKF